MLCDMYLSWSGRWNGRFPLFNFKIGLKLGDVFTRCFSHHQGKGLTSFDETIQHHLHCTTYDVWVGFLQVWGSPHRWNKERRLKTRLKGHKDACTKGFTRNKGTWAGTGEPCHGTGDEGDAKSSSWNLCKLYSDFEVDLPFQFALCLIGVNVTSVWIVLASFIGSFLS